MKNYLKAVGIVTLTMGGIALVVFLLAITNLILLPPLVIFGAAWIVKDDLDFEDRLRDIWGPKENK